MAHVSHFPARRKAEPETTARHFMAAAPSVVRQAMEAAATRASDEAVMYELYLTGKTEALNDFAPVTSEAAW